MPPDEYADEIDRLEARSASDPRTHTFARLADLYRKAGELERALEVVESGLRHHPHYLNARIVHARLLRELGRPADAVAAFERVLRIDSQNLVARAALGELREGAVVQTAAEPQGPESPSRPPASGWLARLEEDWQSERGDPRDGEDRAPAATDSVDAGSDGVAAARAEAPAAGAPDEAAAGGPDEAAADAESGSDPRPEEGSAPAGDREPPEKHGSAPAPSPGRPRRTTREGSGDLETATLAELYARQGLLDEAIGIFERLLARDPYNARLAAALEEARRRARGEGGADVDGTPDGARTGSRRTATAPGPTGEGSPSVGSAPRPAADPRRGEARPERPPAGAALASGAPDPDGRGAPADAESIRAFLGRLLEGRFAPPGRADGGAEVDLDEWLDARGA